MQLRIVELENEKFAVQRRKCWIDEWEFCEITKPETHIFDVTYENTWGTLLFITRYCLVSTLTEAEVALDNIILFFLNKKKEESLKIKRVIKKVKI